MRKFVQLLVFLLLTCFVSCSLNDHAGITSTGNTTKISGIVTRDSASASLARQAFGLVSVDSAVQNVWVYVGADTSSRTDSVQTDSAGYFEFKDLEPGLWVVQTLGDSGWIRSTVSLTKGDSVRVTLNLGLGGGGPISLVVHGPDVELGAETYPTVVIGNQVWFARNLNVDADSLHSWCYGDLDSNCLLFGRLYDWATAMNIDTSFNNKEWAGNDVNHQGLCPTGWHIPRAAEWVFLENAVGGDSLAALALRAINFWAGAAGDDIYAFKALPGGYRSPDSTYQGIAQEAYFWTATENLAINADDVHILSSLDATVPGDHYKGYGYSVRCVKSAE